MKKKLETEKPSQHWIMGIKRPYRGLRGAGYSVLEAWLLLIWFLFIRLISPIVRIRFGVLRNNQIGHTIFETENYLHFKKGGGFKGELHFFSSLVPYGNTFLALKYTQRVHHRKIYQYFYDALHALPKGSRHILAYQLNPFMDLGINSLPDTAPHIHLMSWEILKANALLEKMELEPRRYICFHNRDSAYYEKCNPHNGSVKSEWFNFRDSQIENYLPAMEKMAQEGYKCVRMGKAVDHSLNIENPFIIDYAASSVKGDFFDMALCRGCLFFVGTQTGLTLLPMLFKRPVVWVNSFWRGASFTNNPQDIFIFKKLWLKSEKRFLSFKEMRELGEPPANRGEYYAERGIEVIENTSQEIIDVVTEMKQRLVNEWEEEDEDRELQEKYKRFLWHDYKEKKLKEPRLGAQFLRENTSLLENSKTPTVSIPPLDHKFETSKYCQLGEIIPLNRPSTRRFLIRGWQEIGEEFTWTEGKWSLINFKINSISEPSVFYLRCGALVYTGKGRKRLPRTQRVHVQMNGYYVGMFSVGVCYTHPTDIYFEIPRELTENWNLLRIKLLFPDALSFNCVKKGKNARKTALAVFEMGILEKSKVLSRGISILSKDTKNHEPPVDFPDYFGEKLNWE